MANTLPTEQLSLSYTEVEWTYSRSDSAEDSFDFKAQGGETGIAMLLPAVQAADEAARRSDSSEDDRTPDSFDFNDDPDTVLVTLLLPAVQNAGVESPMEAEDRGLTAKDDGGTAYEYKLASVMISSYDVNGATDADHDRWIDVLSTDWGTSKPAAEAGLRSDGELVQAVSEADMGGDFIL